MSNLQHKSANDYYPSDIKFKVLPNKIYLLTWLQHGSSKQKLLNKSKAFALVNDMNTDKRLRDEVLTAFEAGAIQ